MNHNVLWRNAPASSAPLSESLERCAASLVQARQHGETLARWLPEVRPASVAEAYAVQEAVASRLDQTAVGWKLGCTSVEMQKKLGSRQPIAGRAFGNRVFASGVQIVGARPDMLCVEAEFAFRMGDSLPPREQTYTRAEILTAISSLHAAIEQVESRFTDWQGLPINDIIADNSSHGRLVVGEAITGWRDIDLPACPIRLLADGKLLVEGAGHAVLGDPLNSMVWLANHLSQRGLGLQAGDVVTTGTCTGLTFVDAGATVSVQLPGHGVASLAFLS